MVVVTTALCQACKQPTSTFSFFSLEVLSSAYMQGGRGMAAPRRALLLAPRLLTRGLSQCTAWGKAATTCGRCGGWGCKCFRHQQRLRFAADQGSSVQTVHSGFGQWPNTWAEQLVYCGLHRPHPHLRNRGNICVAHTACCVGLACSLTNVLSVIRF